jgi:hypothetical protein
MAIQCILFCLYLGLTVAGIRKVRRSRQLTETGNGDRGAVELAARSELRRLAAT